MTRFNYFYYGTPITKRDFEANVQESWMDNLDEFGVYSWGGYKAVKIDEADDYEN